MSGKFWQMLLLELRKLSPDKSGGPGRTLLSDLHFLRYDYFFKSKSFLNSFLQRCRQPKGEDAKEWQDNKNINDEDERDEKEVDANDAYSSQERQGK